MCTHVFPEMSSYPSRWNVRTHRAGARSVVRVQDSESQAIDFDGVGCRVHAVVAHTTASKLELGHS